MATKYGDIGKGPKDLLNDDYTSSISLKCKKGAGPVSVTIDTSRDSAGALSSKVGTKFSYASFNVDKAQMKADGARVFETSVKVAPGVKVAFKADKGADLCVDYSQGNFYATGKLDVMDMSKISNTACLSHECGAKIGGETVYALDGKSGLTTFNLGLSYSKGPLLAAVASSSKFTQYNLGVLYKANDVLSIASQTTHSSSTPLDLVNIGGAYSAPFGTVKAKYSGNGMLSACLIRELAPKVKLTAAASVSASDFSKVKTGLGFEI